MAEASCCPFCNALFQPDQAQQSPRGPCCPRCGEPLPALTPPAASLPTGVPASPPQQAGTRAPADMAVKTRHSRRRSNLIVAAVVLLVMITMAAIGLTLALWTEEDRRLNDYKSPAGEWAGIGYLPAECNILCRLDVKELQEEYEANKLLAEPRPPSVDFLLKQVEAWSGMKADMIEYALFGAVFEGSLQANLVVVTRKPYDRAELVKSLKAEKIGQHHARTVYRISARGGETRLWCPEHRIFVIAFGVDFKKGSHDEFPFPPREGLTGQRPELKFALESRGKRDNLFWIAGEGNWKLLLDLINLKQAFSQEKLPELSKEQQKLAQIKTFVVSLDRDLVLNGTFFAGDQETTQWLEKYLGSLSRDDLKMTVAGPPPPDVASGPSAFMVQVQANFTAEQIRQALSELGEKKTR